MEGEFILNVSRSIKWVSSSYWEGVDIVCISYGKEVFESIVEFIIEVVIIVVVDDELVV